MSLDDIWKQAVTIRNEDEQIVAVQLPIDAWRALLDAVEDMQEREAARQRLTRLRRSSDSSCSHPPRTTPHTE